MIKIIGICLLLFALVCFVRTLCAKERARASLVGELHRFFVFLRRQVGCYLLPMSDVARQYSSPRLEECGFLLAVRSGGDVKPSLEAALGRGGRCLDIACQTLSSFGEGYVEDEMRSLDSAISELSCEVKALNVECKRRTKLYSVIGAALGVGVLILFI